MIEGSRTDRPSPLAAFLTAIQFLLVSPAFIKRPFTAQELGAAVGYYPLVGLILGGVLYGADSLLGLVFPPLVRAALVLALWVGLTGGLHLDGFLDSCDGLLGGSTPEKRMEIMRDERLGAFAFAGGTLLLLLKFSALASIGTRLPALLLAPVLGRWAMAAAVKVFPYARPVGLGRAVKEHTTLTQVIQATVFGLVVAAALAAALAAAFANAYMGSAVQVLIALTAAPIAVWLVGRFTLARIPGLTGDIYGALNEIVETIVLLVFSIV